MGDFPGHDTIYLVSDVPELDGNGEEIRDELNRPKMTELIVRVDGCVFEQQITVTPERFEQVSETTNTSNIRWAFLPVVDGQVPAFTYPAGDPVLANPPTSEMRVRYGGPTLDTGGRDWQMRDGAEIQVDLDGIEDHVFAMCERQTG